MVITIAFPGFNDLGRAVTPVFFLMDNFLYQFSAFLSTRSLNFLQNARWNCVLFSSSFIGATVSNPFGGLSFVKTLVKIGIIYATDILLRNKTKIVCLR